MVPDFSKTNRFGSAIVATMITKTIMLTNDDDDDSSSSSIIIMIIIIITIRFGSEIDVSRFDTVRPACFGRVVARSGIHIYIYIYTYI